MLVKYDKLFYPNKTIQDYNAFYLYILLTVIIVYLDMCGCNHSAVKRRGCRFNE